MNDYRFVFHGHPALALAAGALLLPDLRLLVVSDLHLGKAERAARRSGSLLPPYETDETLRRLDDLLATHAPAQVVCLGDSFDDATAPAHLDESHLLWLTRMQAGRRWTWITGNHDPAPLPLPGSQLAELRLAGLVFRHEAQPGARAEISGHYHPKARVSARGRSLSRPCFLVDGDRIIMPAFGTYTGGLPAGHPALAGLMRPGALAILTGRAARPIPMPGARPETGARG